ncbi:MAG: hypothetical protein NW223_12850 [Hyphomicrobiaceae bacterium]|nr:hypothetical protein [Hyphomicrobiaceae bacterium]
MTVDELRTAASRWGADVDRWPPQLQAAARALALTPQGQQVLEQERRLDALLARRPVVSGARAQRATLGVLNRLAEAEARSTRRFALADLLRDWLVPTASLAGSAAIGISLALGLPQHAPAPEVTAFHLILDSTSMLGGIEIR